MTVKQSIAAVLLATATSAASIWGFAQYQEQRAVENNAINHSLYKTASHTEPLAADPIDFEKKHWHQQPPEQNTPGGIYAN